MGHGLHIDDAFAIGGEPLGTVHEILFDLLHDPELSCVEYDVIDLSSFKDRSYMLPELWQLVLDYVDTYYDEYMEAKALYDEIKYDKPRSPLRWYLSGGGDYVYWGDGGKGYIHQELDWLEFIAKHILEPPGRRLKDDAVPFDSESGDGHIQIRNNRVLVDIMWRMD